MTAEPLLPTQVEQKLRQHFHALGQAEQALAVMRDREVASKHELARSRRRALLSGECPKIGRGGWSAAERDAWVGEQTADLEEAYDRAVIAREAAQDHLRVVRDQVEILRSLNASVRLAYAGTPA